MVIIPAGRFVMGSPEYEEGRDDVEGTQHFVTIAEPFALGRYPVTFDEYDEFAAVTGREPPGDAEWGRGQRPVINVAWQDADAYAAWLSQQTGKPYRLPSEAEWEYACRAGTTTAFHVGPTISTDQANYDGNYTYGSGKEGVYREQTVPVTSFPGNAFGLHDMHGNVWEWCADAWHHSYLFAPRDGTAWIAGGETVRVLRGGAWTCDPRLLRCATRGRSFFSFQSVLIGFRVARTLR
jgi:formylglycine-generating enzyme required for sulfatase activity